MPAFGEAAQRRSDVSVGRVGRDAQDCPKSTDQQVSELEKLAVFIRLVQMRSVIPRIVVNLSRRVDSDVLS